MIWTWPKSQYDSKSVGCLNNAFQHPPLTWIPSATGGDCQKGSVTARLGCSMRKWSLGCVVSFTSFDRLPISSPLNDKVWATNHCLLHTPVKNQGRNKYPCPSHPAMQQLGFEAITEVFSLENKQAHWTNPIAILKTPMNPSAEKYNAKEPAQASLANEVQTIKSSRTRHMLKKRFAVLLQPQMEGVLYHLLIDTC